MAISARFSADFTQFESAVAQADVKLKGFQEDANKVTGSLTRMSNSLSGSKLIQDAILMAAAVEKVGGVSALTEKELQRVGAQAKEAAEKMKAIGLGVPENLQKIIGAATPVETALDKVARGLSGSMLIEDATRMAAAVEKVGGVSKLTDKELQQVGTQAKDAAEKMKVLGLGVPENLQKIITAASPVDDALQKVSTSLSGSTLIKDALVMANAVEKIGGVSKLTDKELQQVGAQAQEAAAKMKLLGIGVPENLQKIIAAAKPVETELDKVARSLSGSSLIHDATLMANAVDKIGGTSKLTASELQRVSAQAKEATEKMRAMGLGVPENLQKIANAAKPVTSSMDSMVATVGKLAGAFGIGFSIGAVVNFGKAVLADADALVKLSDKTGVSLQGLQRFQIAGDDAGNTVNDLTSAIVKMEDKLVSGDKSALKALERLRIPFSDIKNLSPENQFIAISDAIRQIHDPAQQVAIAIDLFGKAGAEVLPTLKRGFDDVKGAAVGMSDETVRVLDEAGDIMTKMGRNFKAGAAEALVGLTHLLADGLTPMGRALGTMKREADAAQKSLSNLVAAVPTVAKVFPTMFEGVKADGAEVVEFLRDFEKELSKQEAARKKVAAATDAASKNELAWTQSVTDATVAMNLSVFTLNRYGAVALPAMQSSLEGVDLELHTLASATLPEFGAKLSNVGLAGVKGFGDAQTSAQAMHASLEASRSGISDLSRAFSELAQVSGDSWGGVVQDIAQVVTALNLAQQSMEQYGKATTMMGKSAALAGGAASVIAATGSGSTAARVGGGAASGAMVGSAFGPWGTAIGAGVGALVGWFRSEKAAKQVNDVRDAFVASARGLEILNQHASEVGLTLDKFLQAKNPQEYAAAIDELTIAFEHLDKMKVGASQFGLGKDQLAEAEKNAHEIFDWMEKSGQYTAEQLDKAYVAWQQSMADAGNEAAAAWLKTHAAVEAGASAANKALDELTTRRQSLADSIANEAPEEIMGVIEAQIRGQMAVLDDQIAQQQAKLEAEAQAAADALQDALSRIAPDAIHVPIVWDVPDLPKIGGREAPEAPAGVATGGLVTSSGIQHFTQGGMVLPFRSRGMDTVPAMLTPGELILNANQQKAVGALLSQGVASSKGGASSQPTTTINIHITGGTYDTPASRQRLADQISKALMDQQRAQRRMNVA